MARLPKWFHWEEWMNVARATVIPSDHTTSKAKFILIYSIRLFFQVGRRLWRDQCLRQAAALAYQTMLSIVPLAAIVMAAISALEIDALMPRITGFLEANLLPEAASQIGQLIRERVDALHPEPLGVFGVGTLLFLAVTLLFNVEKVINEIFRTPRKRRLWTRAAGSLLVIVLGPALLGISLFLTGELLVLPRTFGALLPLAFTTAALFFCFWLLPHRKVKVRHALIAALVAGIMFEGVKIGFAFYAKHLGATVSYVYGTLAILPLFMLWNYLGWVIFLFGAELNASLHEVRHYEQLARWKTEG